jgi:UDP-N-acetylglucosamine 4,6-dehydratase
VGRVILLARDELKMSDTLALFAGQSVEGFIGDIRDDARLAWAFRAQVDVVIHAAALKQVPSCQYNWPEAIQTNIVGSRNVVLAAIRADVPRVIALSSDKACAPVNTYGKTKAVMEEMVVWGNAWRGQNRTRLSCVRYGNVIGSRGSVIPTFIRQSLSGTVTVTDPAMTRFWMTLPAAVEFVLSSVDRMAGGEIFIPKLGAMSMSELAMTVAPGCEINVIGRRPGEKLHESMLSADESASARDQGDRFALYPHGATWPIEPVGDPLPEGFSYTSDQAPAVDAREVRAA